MRTIQISTDVFAAIWKRQQEGEKTENEILTRIFDLLPVEPSDTGSGGFSDPRYNVSWAEGFEIFRVYLGKEYRAKATTGGWQLQNTGKIYPSLNTLSTGIGTKSENAWDKWNYIDENGDRAPVSVLRDHALVRQRKRPGADTR